MRLAVLADIHGNLPALEAVIADLERHAPDAVVVDGDLINAVPFSAEVIDRVCGLGWTVVRGNHEFYYLDYGTERAAPNSDDPDRWGQLHWLIDRISPAQGVYLGTLPDDRTLYLPGTQPLRIAHGVPGRNRIGFYRRQAAEKIVAEVASVPQRTLISAHTHVQIDRHIHVDEDMQAMLSSDPHVGGDPHPHGAVARRHWHIVNPGSVGLPLDGRPLAQYALLDSVSEREEPGGWRVLHRAVSYDRRPSLDAYRTTSMLEAGGVISQLFYWEVVTAETELIRFYRWAYANGMDPDANTLRVVFERYVEGTGRDQYVRERDPLHR